MKVVSFYCSECNENIDNPLSIWGEDYLKEFDSFKCLCPYCGNTLKSDRIIEVSDKEVSNND